ncbi:MAG: DUF1127 domain-containing protein [Pseudomonadota bacterium]
MISVLKSSLAPFGTAPNVIKTILFAMETYKQRRALAALDADRLADLGLTQAQAQAEYNRLLWDLPNIR